MQSLRLIRALLYPLRSSLFLTMWFLLSLATFSVQAQSPIVVQTIAGLESLNVPLTNDTVAYVIDYYSGTTMAARGGGHFRWLSGSTATPDGGRYIGTTSTNVGVWERLLDGAIANVKMWGAYGDGVHDDTLAIQTAINTTETWGTSYNSVGELLFPAGQYNITNTLVFNTFFTHITGEGSYNTTVQMGLGIGKNIFVSNNASNYLKFLSADYDHGLLFENMTLSFADDGSTNGHPARNMTNSALVIGIPGEASTIRNVHFVNGGVGIQCLGAGAPGLNVRDVKFDEPAIAGILIQPLPGDTNTEFGGPITLIGISGDEYYSDAAETASLIIISNINTEVTIQSIKAEGDFGGGLVHYYCGNNLNGMDAGHFALRSCYYNALPATGGSFYTTDFVKIDPSPSYTYMVSGPIVTIDQVSLNAVPNLINDTIDNRIVESDTQITTGYSQLAAKVPIVYQANPTGSGGTNAIGFSGSSLMIGQNAVTTFYATNAGWYRIMAPYGDGFGYLDGRVSIVSPWSYESIEMQVSATQDQAPWINVTRCRVGVQVVSQARVISYYDGTRASWWAFVDIYVANPITNSYYPNQAKLTVTLDTEGVKEIGTGQVQLLSPVLPVSSNTPPYSWVVTTNTYR